MKLALLDRDGVLNVDRPDSIRSMHELVLLPGAALAVAQLNEAGWRVAVVTNQSVVGRGLITTAELAAIHDELERALAENGAHLDAIFVCPDAPNSLASRRKPAPDMLLEALDRFGATPDTTPMIGDSLRDMEAAAQAGCRRILVRTGKGRATEAAGLPDGVQPVLIVEDLAAAVDRLLAEAA